jgi:hypothetical protein
VPHLTGKQEAQSEIASFIGFSSGFAGFYRMPVLYCRELPKIVIDIARAIAANYKLSQDSDSLIAIGGLATGVCFALAAP